MNRLAILAVVVLALALGAFGQQPAAPQKEQLTYEKIIGEMKRTEIGSCQWELATATASIKVLQSNWTIEKQQLEAKFAEERKKLLEQIKTVEQENARLKDLAK